VTKAICVLMAVAVAAVAACEPGAVSTSAGRAVVIASALPVIFNDARDASQAIGFAIRQRGSIAGFKLEYRSLDDSLGDDQNLYEGRENIDRLIADSSVLGVVGPWSTPLAMVEVPEANTVPLAMVSPSTTGSCLTVFDPPCQVTAADMRPSGVVTYFRIAAPDIAQGKAMADFAFRRGLRKVAAFNEFGVGGSTYIKGFRTEFEVLGGRMVLQADLAPATTKFDGFLDQARGAGADAVYGVARGSDHACLAALQMKTLLPGATFLGTDGLAGTPECVSEIGTAADGIVATNPDFDPTGANAEATKGVIAAYRKAYPKPTDVDSYTFAAYDSAQILIAAIGRAIADNGGKFPSRAQVVTAVAETSGFHGVTGTYSFDKNGDAVSPVMTYYEVRAGKWVVVTS
jgi:branched-chain amino acid transport system substrate-binding protein